ncbi:MAG: nucleotide exchange factor GrpE [Marinicaulis sp.]|nr:nucleotide exchange factor GrpE [Marinicaulis sp.]NNL90115.1 nucleotide exchange factor GrpE [Marinicaulis sp.]
MQDNNYPPNKGQEDDADALPDELTDEEIAAAIAAGGEDAEAAPGDEALKEELSNLNDQILRLAAELENTRRRADREKADAGRYAIANFARDLLGVADNFERALHAAGGEDANPSTEALSGIVAGLRMTENELLSVLERHGVKRINPAGEKFDPNLHQAVAQIPGGAVPAGHVVDVAQPGFTIGNRVLRAAMVTVSSGLSETPQEETQDAGEPTTGDHIDTQA